MSPTASGALRAATAAVCYGLLGIFASLAFERGANVAGALAFRAAVIVAFAAACILSGVHSPRLRQRAVAAWRPLAAIAVCSAIASITYFVAVERMAPALVTLLIYVYPALTVLGSRLLGWTSLGPLAALATAMTLAGVVVTIGIPDEPVDALAVGLSLLNGVAYSAGLLYAQRALVAVGPLTVYAIAIGGSSIVLLGGAFAVSDPAFGSGTAIVYLLAAGLVSTVLAAVLQLTSVRLIGGASAAVITSLEIVTVVIASALVFDDPISLGVALGAALVIAGAALAPRGIRPHPRAAPAE